jgi:hypothetical protein
VPASKRRRAATRLASASRVTPAAAAETVAPVAVETPAPEAAHKAKRRLWPQPDVTRARSPAVPVPGADRTWGRVALVVLLALVMALEMLVGLALHFAFHRNRLILVDLFFFNAVLALPATMLLSPLVKRLMHQHRHLRLLESLSLGAVYALVVTLVTLTFLHPPSLPSNATADQLMDALRIGDIPGIVLADLLAIVVTAQIYPGLNRLVTAPGRRAKQRMAARGGRPAAKRSAAPRGRRTTPDPPAKGPRSRR